MSNSYTRPEDMNKENTTAMFEEPTVRMTRARAKALSAAVGKRLSKFSSEEAPKRATRANSKRTTSDENKASVAATTDTRKKKRAVLKDVTNVPSGNSPRDSAEASKIRTTKQELKHPVKENAKVSSNSSAGIQPGQENVKTQQAEDLSKQHVAELQEIKSEIKAEGEERILQNISACGIAKGMASMPTALQRASKKGGGMDCQKTGWLHNLDIIDIDSNSVDPQLCSLYASDIYRKLRVAELDHRPSINYMEQLQEDITANMRGILIDWLVEVSEEYKLVPDTLYLTANLIDRFLSQKYIQKQRLQLLGVTCMLIASKYEEICAPRVEEFCFITDNTYTRDEVLEMETDALNLLHFQLSVPTTKTFLRRFIQAAQVPCKVSCVQHEFLANYLAELTLVEYSFLKFLPSLVAASAVFLARWTLDQSKHPWVSTSLVLLAVANPTLEHYTTYSASELKNVVLALEELQLNTSGSSLNAIREKYRQQKFKCVAALTSAKPVESLF